MINGKERVCYFCDMSVGTSERNIVKLSNGSVAHEEHLNAAILKKLPLKRFFPGLRFSILNGPEEFLRKLV